MWDMRHETRRTIVDKSTHPIPQSISLLFNFLVCTATLRWYKAYLPGSCVIGIAWRTIVCEFFKYFPIQGNRIEVFIIVQYTETKTKLHVMAKRKKVYKARKAQSPSSVKDRNINHSRLIAGIAISVLYYYIQKWSDGDNDSKNNDSKILIRFCQK